MAGMEKAIGRCRSADAGSDYLMRGWGADDFSSAPLLFSPSPLFTALNVLYRWCFKGAGKSTKNRQDGLQFRKVVYSMDVVRTEVWEKQNLKRRIVKCTE